MSQKKTTNIKVSPKTRKKIKDIEDRIEQKYKATDVLLCLNTIHKLNDKDENHEYLLDKKTKENFEKIFEQLSNNPEFCSKTQSREHLSDIDTIHEIVGRLGTAATLAFIDSQLLVNIEKFFSGLLLSYMTIFDKNSKRLRVVPNSVFTEAEDKKNHNMFHRLRDKWYAHTEIKNKKNPLVYEILNDEIKFNEGKCHVQNEYFANHYKKLSSCTTKLLKYIENDICERKLELEENLPEKDKTILKKYYKTKETENSNTK